MMDITWKYVKQLKKNDVIEEFEKKYICSFPQDLKDCLIKNNGGRPSLKYYDLGNEKDKEFKTLFSFNEDDIENIYKYMPLDSSDKTLIPFASDPAGNIFVVKNNSIGLWFHESDEVIIIANTFSEFLSKLHD